MRIEAAYNPQMDTIHYWKMKSGKLTFDSILKIFIDNQCNPQGNCPNCGNIGPIMIRCANGCRFGNRRERNLMICVPGGQHAIDPNLVQATYMLDNQPPVMNFTVQSPCPFYPSHPRLARTTLPPGSKTNTLLYLATHYKYPIPEMPLLVNERQVNYIED